MKNKLFKIILFCSSLLMHWPSGAQEVFFLDPNKTLNTIWPNYYYPLIGDNSALAEFTSTIPGRELKLAPFGTVMPVIDRWGYNNRAARVSGEFGGLVTPASLNSDLLSYKTLNTCFWVKFDNNIYNGTKEGALISVARNYNDLPKISITIKNKRIHVYQSSAGVQRLLGTMDVPIDLLNSPPGIETNGYIFVAISSVWNNDGNRLRLYVGRPGGHLYCKYFYFSPFTIFQEGDGLFIGGSIDQSKVSVPIGISDLMFFTNYNRAKMMHPDDILNLYYLQSPMYEGVSYRIAGTDGIWGLETRRNTGAALAENYISVEPVTAGSSQTPFGFDRFCFEKSTSYPGTWNIRSMANGGGIASNVHAYMFTDLGGDAAPFPYTRKKDPRSNFQVHPNIAQFGFLNNFNPNYCLIPYESGGKKWLTFMGWADKEVWHMVAANRVFRGPERLIDESDIVNLRVVDQNVTMTRTSGWDYITTSTSASRSDSFAPIIHGQQPYVRSLFKGRSGSNYLNRHSGVGDIGDPNWIIGNTPKDNFFQLLYVKNDANGKPQYMLRSWGDKASLSLGVDGTGPNQYVRQRFNGALNNDGSVPDRFLWSVCKISGGWPSTHEEKAKLDADDLKSQQNTSKVNYNGLSETDWPDGPPKP